MAVAHVRPDILYAWKGPSLLITNTRGECSDGEPLAGFYFREARFLRTVALRVNGERPWPCEAAAVSPDTLLFTFVHPEISEPGGGGTGQSGDDAKTDAHGIPERALHLQVSYHVGIAHLDVGLTLVNRARRPVTFEVTWLLGADFADIQEGLASHRQQEAPVATSSTPGLLEFVYRHDRLPYRTSIRHASEWRTSGTELSLHLTLNPQQCVERMLRVVPRDGEEVLSESGVQQRETVLRRWMDGFARVEMPGNRVAEDILASNVRDFASFPLLTGPRDEWLVTQAGMPLYPAFFGRDAVTAGWQAGYVDRAQSLDAALTRLGRLQSDRVDEWRDAEPGRIPYQVRTGPLAILNLNPYSAYYADFASPLMFVVSLANLYAWTGQRADVQRHWDTARRILEWAREYGDPDRDGYLEYQTRSKNGTKNQGWKDSGDAIVYEDGRPVPSPIATCEIQGYWYIAQELMAALSAVMNAPADATAFHAGAADLKARFNRDWWNADDRFFALALDPDKRQVRALTSNVGHCLATGIIDRERLPMVVGRMFAPDLFSGWGIRTLSSGHAYYDPLSYHRGTVWAVEQGTIVFGLRRFGFDARAVDLARAMFDLAQLYPEYRIPECVGGYSRGERPTPAAYPRANTPQLWNATAFPLTIQSLLGLLPIAPAETLVLDPVLPAWIPDLVLRDLRVGAATVSLRFWRNEHGSSRWEVLHKRGTLHVVRQPPPESVSAGLADRAGALLESLAK
jgi:glycogen debranching enzyme